MSMIMNISHDNQQKELQEKQTMQHDQQLFNHFSHRHPLELTELNKDVKAICSGCELDISGPAYVCTKAKCTFLLHDLCFDLPRHIRHPSHPKHPLRLSSPPYANGEFTCKACAESGHGFTYHCDGCKFDLHVECASLPEVENREDHQHPLILMYDKMEGPDCVCYICYGSVTKGCWSYCCLTCKIGAHVECVGVSSQSMEENN